MVDDAHPLDLVIANAGYRGACRPGAARRGCSRSTSWASSTPSSRCCRGWSPGARPDRADELARLFVNRPGTAAYCASKAAVRIWGEGLGARLRPAGIAVSVICPGFVDTPLTRRNPFPMPLLMDAEPAARLIRRGWPAARARIAFPGRCTRAPGSPGCCRPACSSARPARWPGKE